MFEDNSALIDEQEQEQEKDNLTVIDNMTLENTLKLFELKSLLSDLDTDLREVKKGKKTIEDHRKYFTEIDDKLKKLGLIYHPDMVQLTVNHKYEVHEQVSILLLNQRDVSILSKEQKALALNHFSLLNSHLIEQSMKQLLL